MWQTLVSGYHTLATHGGGFVVLFTALILLRAAGACEGAVVALQREVAVQNATITSLQANIAQVIPAAEATNQTIAGLLVNDFGAIYAQAFGQISAIIQPSLNTTDIDNINAISAQFLYDYETVVAGGTFDAMNSYINGLYNLFSRAAEAGVVADSSPSASVAAHGGLHSTAARPTGSNTAQHAGGKI